MKRYGWLGIGTFLIVAMAWQALKPPTDAEMIATFNTHRASFDQLVDMYIADDQDMWISTLGYWVATTTSSGVSLDRRSEYLALLWRTGISSIGIGNARDYRGTHQFIPFDANASLPLPGSAVKSFLYATEPLRVALTKGNTQAYEFPAGAYRKVCRSLEDLWFICVDYAD
jgi:hypothetical protein